MRRDRTLALAAAVSLALHGAVLAAVIWLVRAEPAPQPTAFSVEVAPLPARVAAAEAGREAAMATEAKARPPAVREASVPATPAPEAARPGAGERFVLESPPAPPPRRKPVAPAIAAIDAIKALRVVVRESSPAAPPPPRPSPVEGEGEGLAALPFVPLDAIASKPLAGERQGGGEPQARSSDHLHGSGDATISAPSYSGAGLGNPQPRYPYLARERGEEGRVVLRVQVSAAGSPKAVSIRSSSGYRLLDRAALEAVRGWRFVPAAGPGGPVAGSLDVAVRFRLTD